MKCKKHPADLSSSVGVCASCLSERLTAIIAAQAAARAQHQQHRRSETQQQTAPVSFPKSSSPYIAQRKSETVGPAEAWKLHGGGGGHPRFFSTPLVGPTGKVSVEIKKKKNKSIFSSLFSGLFSRSKSGKSDLGHGPLPYPGVSIDSCSATPSWFSAAVPDRRKKTTRTFSVDETTMAAHRKPCRNRDRGMSPARYSDEEDEHCHGGSSGYSSESSQGWRQTPQRNPATTRRGGGRAPTHSKTVSSLNFCLSPLVRAPANQKGGGAPPDMMAAGESRAPAKAPHFSTTPFCKNRSRKLADFGRYSHNPTH